MSKLFAMVVKVLAVAFVFGGIAIASPYYLIKGELTDTIAGASREMFGQKAYDLVYDIDKVICNSKILVSVMATSFVALIALIVVSYHI